MCRPEGIGHISRILFSASCLATEDAMVVDVMRRSTGYLSIICQPIRKHWKVPHARDTVLVR